MGLAMASPLFCFLHAAFLVLCLGYGFSHVLAGSVQGGNETDRLALLAFKSAIADDPFGALNSWNESIHFCQWFGVICGRRHQRVTGLWLDHQKLTGSISSHVANMSFLRELMLPNNSLSGELPPELGRLRRLKLLAVTNNSISGEIPANISGCVKLDHLGLYGNRFVGKIPAELGSLTRLTVLVFAKNNLTGGLPSTFGNLSLEILYASENSISGSIPYSLGRLRNLKFFAVAGNQLTGTIPPPIFNLSSLNGIDVSANQIQGSLPSDLGNLLPNIGFLGVFGNLFAGSIPISISNATKLSFLYFSLNKFTGKVPPLGKLNGLVKLLFNNNHLGTRQQDDLRFLDSVINATKLRIVHLGSNQFGGVLPESICNFSSTTTTRLYFDTNEISGNIPTCVGNLINLDIFFLGNNHLRGKIPANIWNLQKLFALYLSDNNFSGKIPLSFQNFTSLAFLLLDGNNFDGGIPSTLEKCPLQFLDLSKNNLIGTIPPEVMSLSSLLSLNLSQNQLHGSLPMEIGRLINLETLDVSGNMLSGKIPNTLGSCVKLMSIHMQGNNFSGILPSSLINLRGMVELDISRNNFSGEIPDYLQGFVFLELLNLSFNNFEGVVPEKGIFKNATAICVVGNNKLCGGVADLQLSSCKLVGFRKKIFTKQLIIPTCLEVLGLILGLYFLYRWWFRKRIEVPTFRWFGKPFPKLSYQTLLKATNGFSPANLVGVGRFGSVYKGLLDLDQGEKIVAVKVINLQYRGAFKSFIAECKALRNIKHRNLLKVLTACSSVDYEGNDFKALVYEFIVNGSLDEWLHPNENEALESSRTLNLLQRLNITIDIASALDYLHHHCSEPIVHCDLKPDNVLLDNEMSAHLGDFGLTKFLLEATCESSANQSSSIGIRGTIGYTAPEYGMGNEVSTYGDVYSYGILLLEMFTGKRPTDSMFTDGLSLHTFAKMTPPEQVANIVDPVLFEQWDMGEASSRLNNTATQSSPSIHKIHECLVSILKVGITCSQELPTDRMDIQDVVSQLHAIRNSLIEVGAH